MAFAFAEYANQIWPQAEGEMAPWVLVAYAAASIIVLTGINILGVQEGKWTQNVLTTAKLVGLAAIVAVGFTHAPPEASPSAAAPSGFSLSDFGLAMIFVLFTYGGWNEMAFVSRRGARAAKEHPASAVARHPGRNGDLRAGELGVRLRPRAAKHRPHQGAAADVLRLGIGQWAEQAISVLICISALGAINGQIFTGSRIYYAMGTDHRLYAWLGRWNARRGTPVCSLLIQGAITLALSIWFGLTKDGFESMVKFTTPGFWFFLTLVGASLFVLRRRDPEIERPYRVPGYPLTPILFCLSCSFMVYSSVAFAVKNRSWEAIWSIAILLVGVVMSFYRPGSTPAGQSDCDDGSG